MSKEITSVKESLSEIRKVIASKISKNTNAVLAFELIGAGGGLWSIVISNGEVSLNEGLHKNPTITLVINTSDLNKIVNGDIDRRTLASSGQLTISGDKLLGEKILDLFGPRDDTDV